MKPPTRIALQSAVLRQQFQSSPIAAAATTTTLPLLIITTHQRQQRNIHTTPPAPATVSPIHGTGPPPEPPVPAVDSATSRIERRRKQAELLERAQEIRRQSSPSSSSSSSSLTAAGRKARDANLLRKRFWKEVHVREVDGAYEVHLDARPLRRPDSKHVVRLPRSKPLLAAALAAEWDALVSAQQATRQHLIPLTSLVCRALDIADEDAAAAGAGVSSSPSSPSSSSIREGLANMLLRYLDTDSLLCWAPPAREEEEGRGDTLRDRQKRAAEEVVGYLTRRVWPGVQIEPVLDGESIVPRRHAEVTRQVVRGWIAGLSAWELAGLERGVLAGKGLLGAVRLLVEWSEGPVGVGAKEQERERGPGEKRFGVEEAARLASIEVDWQTGRWGEVEDTHDVEKEDLRRQLGSVVLLVTGTGAGRK
ncbi:ATP12-domain-containing protein [Daldinia caldariorum]|uniref:ATP12-domain-containing protein n=1 Tax=Daldinia caldariorum TaxID=326644 RepID=UPI00200764EA|nr:ATP12-domain-containing protein [Daldinia caldariorum]KAI1472421.1 ATP12-domain-containing protein [Daldinia caldariorum]